MRLALGIGILCFLAAVAIFFATTAPKAHVYGEAYVYGAILRSAFYVGLAAGGCAYAMRCGGAPERIAGWIILATVLADPLLHLVLQPRFREVDPTHLIVDIARFAGLTAIALRANRYWPIWLSAFQLLALAAHLAKAMDVAIHPVVYGVMQVVWSYGILIGLILATRTHRRLTANGATRRSWSVFSPS
ncbi:MAG: hypothetical protein IIZ38_18930 [Sphingomonas sp.]|uniref:hypothetical protein n=1 Tax=Sphingomonas sp. TaxID=28214 RepID=UPI0025F216AD|nr:hypothetical protein [Sphingomonas sp.]MBQ1500386.1 hypothetical protein [Sphingomonas sp.]MBQ8102672.1 hypothetical protein [Afipia sp.]